jgi:hypothetical protein
MQFKKAKEIPVSVTVMNKETIMTQSYELPLNAFQLSGLCRCYGVPYS